jgi:hypothetical protein
MSRIRWFEKRTDEQGHTFYRMARPVRGVIASTCITVGRLKMKNARVGVAMRLIYARRDLRRMVDSGPPVDWVRRVVEAWARRA